MTTYEISIKIQQLIDFLYRNVFFFQIIKKYWVFWVLNGTPLWNFADLPEGDLERFLREKFLYRM